MTNHWIDLRNTDCAMIIGSNAAENHPMSMKWLAKARKDRGAKIIHVDPRFTRTSSKADIFAPIRPGTDIAFIGGLINYILTNNLYHSEYVVKYTNASFLVNPDFSFTDGLFSGYDPASRKYDTSTWTYQVDANGVTLRDETLTDPRTVFQLMKQHYSRYNTSTVSSVTGCPVDVFNQVASTFGATGAYNKTGTIMYAMGTTQHTVGSENVRVYAMLQLLLGNMGRPGGGVNAMRGESNVQGSTDMALLSHLVPGYMNAPLATTEYATLDAYIAKETPTSSYWTNKPKFFKSLLKAWWGSAATSTNEFAYQYLPKRSSTKNYTHIGLFEEMYNGTTIKGAFMFGQNPVVAGPNGNKEALALEKLQWIVAVDLWETETADFWKRPGANSASINTEVFLLPAAASFEKDGSIANSGRWIQWRWKGKSAPGLAKSDLWIIHQLATKIKELYAPSTNVNDKPIKDLYWPYDVVGEPDIEAVAKEINGYSIDPATGAKTQLSSFGSLKDDGTTASGCWVFCGMYTIDGNKAKNRNIVDSSGIGGYPNWSYAWPLNRRIIYNRASADPAGNPWCSDKTVIWWDSSQAKWVGYDVPDFVVTKAPTDAGGTDPFIMKPEGVGGLFALMADGPFPEHYEPWESPVTNAFSTVQLNPVAKEWNTALNPKGDAASYPYIGTTYRLSEHWQAGAMTRNLDWLKELIPELFVEISESLAAAQSIVSGNTVEVSSARGVVRAKALVTKRMQPLSVRGQSVEIIGIPWHFGFQGLATGDIANKLTPHIGDANTHIPEYKAFLCNLRKVI